MERDFPSIYSLLRWLQKQGLGQAETTPYGSLMWLYPSPTHCAMLYCFPSALAGSWIGGGTAGT